MTREEFCIWALRLFSWGDDFRFMNMTGTQQAEGGMEERGGASDGYKSRDMERVFFFLAFSEQRQNKQSDWNTLGSQTCVAVSLSIFHPFLLFLF